MIEMTLFSRHRIRNSSPGGLSRARYLSVTEAPHNTNFHTWMGKKQFCFFQTAETGNRTPDSGVKGSGANHYPRAPTPKHETLESCLRGCLEDRTCSGFDYDGKWDACWFHGVLTECQPMQIKETCIHFRLRQCCKSLNPITLKYVCVNPLSPHDALTHHFTSLKTDLIF